ncbi:MAG TPA: hypothetical protein VKZ70_14345 [Burkholderiaceae bacterium]|nr:hypothetical protein [Burkholderiaceae bacterium]
MEWKRSNVRICQSGLLLAMILTSACTPIVTGQMAEGGLSAAKTAFGALSPTAAGTDERQLRIQNTLNEVDVGDEVAPTLEKIGEPPRQKSGNAKGYTCYEFPSVYSSSESAVLMAREGKVVFYGNSRCTEEMNDANFRAGGKYQ